MTQAIPRSDARDHIRETARQLFARRGPDAVTMADVARAAGVARGTVFNHFGSKGALVEAITEDVLVRYQELLDQALADRETPTVALARGLFEFMGRGIEEDRHFHRAVFREIAKLSLGLDEGGPGMRARQANRTRLVQLLGRGQDRGELSLEHRPETLASAFDSLVYGTITHWLYDDASEPLHERMRDAVEVFLRPVALAPDDQAASVPTPLALPRRSKAQRAVQRRKRR